MLLNKNLRIWLSIKTIESFRTEVKNIYILPECLPNFRRGFLKIDRYFDVDQLEFRAEKGTGDIILALHKNDNRKHM